MVCIMPLVGAFSSIDDRYYDIIAKSGLQDFIGEAHFIKQRGLISLEYFVHICSVKHKQYDRKTLAEIVSYICTDEFVADVKEQEKITRHDISAIIDVIQNKMQAINIPIAAINMLHYGLTSQDLNTVANSHSIKEMMYILAMKYRFLISRLSACADKYSDIITVTYTHGQPAVPGRLGNHFRQSAELMKFHMTQIDGFKVPTKFGGAIGECTAHVYVDPDINWNEVMDHFIVKYYNGLQRIRYTKQTLPYGYWNRIWDWIKNMNLAISDIQEDLWLMTLLGVFQQKAVGNGSSTMPQKVNPIELEQAKGFIIKANCNLEPLYKINVTPLHRDLSDSTILRDIGLVFANSLMAVEQMVAYLIKIRLNQSNINKTLLDNSLIVAEGLQTILRNEGIKNPYYIIKDLTQNISTDDQHKYIETLKDIILEKFPDISFEGQELIANITVHNYIGLK
jgi:adenylosuccinate lyase